MNYSTNIRQEINKFSETELINSNELYNNSLSYIPEFTYYKVLERMVKKEELVRISKGVYVIPKNTEFGQISYNQNKVLDYYLENHKGVYKGYYLFNSLGLTTQISKKIELYSTNLHEETKTIKNIKIERFPVEITDYNSYLIELLEVLENYAKIEDLNKNMFIKYLEKSVALYNEDNLKNILKVKKYKKSTIAFLESILNRFGKETKLKTYLNRTSNYNIPNWV